MAVSITDTTGFSKDDKLDQEGFGLYEEELNAGNTPNRFVFREIDDKLETINLQNPKGLGDGIQIKVGTRGTEVSTTVFDNRHEAGVFKITAKFNTRDADRFNKVVFQKNFPFDFFQGNTFHDILTFIVEQSGGVLQYDGSAPKEFAGPISFSNTQIPQAISQLLEIEGNTIWTVQSDNFTVTVINRAPGGKPIGIVGQNVIEQGISGFDQRVDLPALVTDKDNRGLKTQYGGPGFVLRDSPDPFPINPTLQGFGALDPLELEIDASEIVQRFKTQIDKFYGYTRLPTKDPNGNDRIKWATPKDSKGKEIRSEVILVQKGQMVTAFSGRNLNFVSVPYQSALLTHPNKKFAFEVEKISHPEVFKESSKPNGKSFNEYVTDLEFLIVNSEGKITKEIGGGRLLGAEAFLRVEKSPIYVRDGNQFRSAAIVAEFLPTRALINGFVDLENGEFFLDAGPFPSFQEICSATKVSTTIQWEGDTSSQRLNVIVSFVGGVLEANYRAHIVTVEPMPPQQSPIGAKAPFGEVFQGDFEKHNVIFNAAEVKGFEVPATKARDDTERMKERAANLEKTLTFAGQAKGTITIFPGNRSLKIGQPANGGVITKIKHSFVPFFKTTFTLEGTLDIDNPEAKQTRRKIQEFEGAVKINSSQITQNDRSSQSGTSPQGGSRIVPHTHSDDLSGGSRLGDVEVDGLTITGELGDGRPNLTVSGQSLIGSVDLKWFNGIGRFISGDVLIKVTGFQLDSEGRPTVNATVFDDEDLPEFKGTLVLFDGEIITDLDELKRNVEVGQIFAIQFIEKGKDQFPTAVIVAKGVTRLITDHTTDDEKITNISTKIFGTKKDATGKIVLDDKKEGDLDDLLIATKKIPDKSDVVLKHYMSESGFDDDDRKGYITGPHFDSFDRTELKQGCLADVFRYWQQDRNKDSITIRTDSLYGDDAAFDIEDNHEGPLDFFDTHNNVVSPDRAFTKKNGLKGSPIVFDELDWPGSGEEFPRGLRYKVVSICDHENIEDGGHFQGVPTKLCPNESSMIINGNFTDWGDLDDLFIIKDNRLRLFMKNYDPCATPKTVSTQCDDDNRFGLLSDGEAMARLADVFEYHDTKGQTPLDLKATANIKLSEILGKPKLVGPLHIVGDAKETPSIHSSSEHLYGYLVNNPVKVCKGNGSWVIEIPFDICASETFSEVLKTLLNDINDRFNKVEECVEDGDKRILEIINKVEANMIQNLNGLRDSTQAATNALAAAISACACCTPRAPIIAHPGIVNEDQITIDCEINDIDNPCGSVSKGPIPAFGSKK